ncbi:MAG: glycosyltransferase [Streptosporangiales bacterium]|nr:glycosyltransferase [Streptosporangiales bacterium]
MARAVGRWVGRHWLFLTLLAAGIALRVVATLAYLPSLFFVDSVRYLGAIDDPDPGGTSPLGYTFLLLGPVLRVARTLVAAPIANHVLGVLIAVGAYTLLRRWGAWPWLAALATAPVLLDAYQLQIEQLIMSDTLFQALLLGAILLLARRNPGPVVAGLAGGVLGAAGVSRLVGLVCVVVAVGYLLLTGDNRRRRLSTVAVLLVAYAVPLLAYATYYNAWYPGQFRITRSDVMATYSRVAPFADCRGLTMPDYQRVLCEDTPPEDRRHGPDWYHWNKQRPVTRLEPPPGVSNNAAVAEWTRRIIRHQPLDLVQAVAFDFLRGFWWSKETLPGEPSVDRWRFPPGEYQHSYDVTKHIERWGGGERRVQPDLAAFLVDYQKVGFTRGTIVGACLLAAVAGALGLGRARRSGARALIALIAGIPCITLVVAAAVEFSWRYQLPAILLFPVAGALAITAMFRRTEETKVLTESTLLPETSGPSDESTDAQALREFADRYGDARFAPVVVVIAAYNEAGGLGAVVDEIPRECRGLDVDTLVVDDGSADETYDVALKHDAYACRAPRNRGQGAALRLGYQLARERGAQYIVTTDADGQYDIAGLDALLEPLLDGTADFVTGSRALGRTENSDLTRRVGTTVFAWLVSALTGTRVTDTSFGFRAMRAELTRRVKLRQPQYQSAELLISVLARGHRVREVPLTMLRRNQGESKKGGNLVYGYRYLRVVVGTWRRERLRRKTRSKSTKRTANSTP